jgi:hypothetical protein
MPSTVYVPERVVVVLVVFLKNKKIKTRLTKYRLWQL